MIAFSASPIIQIRCPGANVIEFYMIYAGVMFFYYIKVFGAGISLLVHLSIVFPAMFPRRRFFSRLALEPSGLS